MSVRWDNLGLLWEDMPTERSRGRRTLGPVPPIPETGWVAPAEFPNIRFAPWIGIDCETWDPELNEHGPGWARGKGHVVGVSIAVPWGKWYFPIRHQDPGSAPEWGQPHTYRFSSDNIQNTEAFFAWLNYSLSGDQPKIGAHILYDYGWLAHEGVVINGPIHDVQYAEGLIDETARVALDTLGWKYLKRGKLKDTLKEWVMDYYTPSEQHWRGQLYRAPVQLVGPYAEEDAMMPYEILVKQWPILVNRGLMNLYEMECKLIRLLVAMRFAGVTVDLAQTERIRDKFTQRVNAIHTEAERIAGVAFSATAPESIAVAFDKLSLPYGRTRTGKPSFTIDALKIVRHPFTDLILEERHLKKLISTFIDGYILNAHVNGKVYCSFHPMVSSEGGAKTGRFSSSDPNLQNIPTRTEEGRLLRSAFVHDAGHRLFRVGDYSQIEYRMLAHFATGHSSIPGSFEAANDVRAKYNADPNLDYHDMISELINAITGLAIQMKKKLLPGTTLAGGSPLVREHIKTLNFACVYGVGKDHLTEMLGVMLDVALQVLGAFHKAVPFAKSTMKAISEEVGRSGICTTILNRQTHFDMWEPDSWGGEGGMALPYQEALEQYGPSIRRAFLYAALNYRLQGSAADVMKKGMLDCWENGVFAATGVPRLTVHDELGFSDPGNVPEDAWRELIHTMETTIPFSVPIKFDMGAGAHWLEAKGK